MAKTEKDAIQANRAEAVAAFLTSKGTYAASGFSGRLINPGYTGKVASIELRELEGTNVTKRTKFQGAQMVGGKLVANENEVSVVLSLVFEDGRTLALPTLTNHPETTIDGTAALEMSGEDWAALVGKTITCVDREADEKRPNIRVIRNEDGSQTRTNNPMQKYTFALVG